VDTQRHSVCQQPILGTASLAFALYFPHPQCDQELESDRPVRGSSLHGSQFTQCVRAWTAPVRESGPWQGLPWLCWRQKKGPGTHPTLPFLALLSNTHGPAAQMHKHTCTGVRMLEFPCTRQTWGSRGPWMGLQAHTGHPYRLGRRRTWFLFSLAPICCVCR
jgi:hypothetical protein